MSVRACDIEAEVAWPAVWLVVALFAFAPASTAQAEQPQAEQSQAEQPLAEQSVAEQSLAEQSPAQDTSVIRAREAGPADEPAEAVEPGLWPTVVAVFPGAIFHGSGLWLAGDHQTAYDLARVEAVGLLASTLSLIGIFATGASGDTIELFYYPGLVGASALILPWFADIYGSSVGGRQAGARSNLAPVEARVGYAYIHDPLFDYAHFSHAQAEVRLEPLRLVPSAWIGVDDDNQRLRLEANFRLLGPRASQPGERADGSFVDVESGFTYHNFGTEDFETVVLEAALAGRYDMRRLSPTLGGSFAELALGIGSQLMGWGVDDAPIGEDVSALMLMRTAFGLYFGPRGARYGEAKLYYNHRHDDFAAGSGIGSDTDGLLGHVGVEGFYYLSPNWGAFADFKAGSSYIGLAGVTFRYGGS